MNTCTTPVTLIVSIGHLLGLLVRILPASYDRKPCFLHKPVEFQRLDKNQEALSLPFSFVGGRVRLHVG